jgi:hypothetical protein
MRNNDNDQGAWLELVNDRDIVKSMMDDDWELQSAKQVLDSWSIVIVIVYQSINSSDLYVIMLRVHVWSVCIEWSRDCSDQVTRVQVYCTCTFQQSW